MPNQHHTTPWSTRARWALPVVLLWSGIAAATPLAYTDVVAVKVDNTAGVALNLLANDEGTAPMSVTAINGTALTGNAQDIAVTGGLVRVTAGGAMTFVPDGSSLGTNSFSYAVTDATGTTPDGQVKVFLQAQSLTADTSSALQDTVQSGNIWSNDPNATTESASLTLTGYTIADITGTQALGTPVTIAGVGDFSLQATGAWTFTPVTGYSGAVPQITYTAKRTVSTTGYTTAVDDSNQPVTADPHYWLNSVTGLVPVNAPPRTTPGYIGNHPWQSSFFGGGRPISSQNAGFITSQQGDFTYGTAFNLPEGVDPSTATAVLSLGSDDFASMDFKANSNAVAMALIGNTPTGTVKLDNSTPGALQAGLNQLSMLVKNTTGWHALVVFSFTLNYDDVRTSTLDIKVTPVNAPPVAVNDSFTTAMDTPLTMTAASLLGNDSDPNGDTLTITSVQSPVNGAVSLSGGNVVFTPATGFTGTATYTYTINDGHGGTATATVTITIPVSPGSPGGLGTGGTASPAPIPVGGAGFAALATALLAGMAGWRLRQRRRVS